MPEEIRKLSADQIINLNKDGHNLSAEKYYVIGGLFNDQPNEAADPFPFQIATSALDKIAKTSIGRPWIPNGDNLHKLKKHVRPHPWATAAQIVEFQKEFAGGEMVAYIHNSTTHNVYSIIEIFPEFIEMVEKKQIYPYLSPMIGNQLPDKKTGQYIDGEVLHIHSVKTPGYPPTLAQFKGSCTGGIKQCMDELRPMAASGTLLESRKSIKINYNEILKHLETPHAASSSNIDHKEILKHLE